MSSLRWGKCCIVGLVVVTAAVEPASAGPVDLEFRPAGQSVAIGDPVRIGVYAVSTDGQNQSVGFVSAVVRWNPEALVLVGHDEAGAFSWDSSGFPSDSAGVNSTFLDGDAYYQAIVVQGGALATATPSGTLVTTLEFTAESAASGSTAVSILDCIGSSCTIVLDRHPFDMGATDVTGAFALSAEVTVLCQTGLDCDDGNPCTDDVCGAGNVCFQTPDDGNDPSDGSYCNGVEVCTGGQVSTQPGSVPDCDDLLSCTDDVCNEATDQCDNTLLAWSCLISGVCHVQGQSDPANDCGACDADLDTGAWSSRPIDSPCGSPSQNNCDLPDSCDGAGLCRSNHLSFGYPCGNGDASECSAPDSCDGAGACQPNHATDGTACSDDLYCTTAQSCSGGECVGTDFACANQVCDEATDTCKAVNLELLGITAGPVVVGETFEVDLLAVSDTGVDQTISAMSVVLQWDAMRLELLGKVDNGPYGWMVSEFPDDSALDGLNDSFQDGDGLYNASSLPSPNPPAVATVGGLNVTTFQFRALSAGVAQVEIVPALGQFSKSKVTNAETLGLDITGQLDPPATVEIIECTLDEHCDDGEYCTGVETCLDNVCIPGTEPSCDDGLFCNGMESCEIGVGCVSEGNPCPDPASCDDGADNCGGCYAPTVQPVGGRYLTVTPAPGGDPVALLVTGSASDAAVACLSMYVQSDDTLGVTPTFRTPAEWGTVYLSGSAIRPGTTYDVQTDCRVDESGYVSNRTRDRTWVWGDVNGDGMVEIDDVILVFDGSQGVFSGGTTVENLDLSPCDPDGLIDGADIASVQAAFSGGAEFDCDAPCQPCFGTNPPLDEPVAIAKNRYLSFVGGNPGRRTAIRVTLVDLPAPHDVANGRVMWAAAPQSFTENAGKTDPADAPGSPTYWTAALGCDPYFTDWSALGAVHLYDAVIVPDGQYQLQSIDELCEAGGSVGFSAPLTLDTGRWGDIVGTCETTPCGPPDGTINVTTDVTAVLEKFKNLSGAPIKARSDVEPATPDGMVNISDVTFALEAFRGFAYPFPPGSDPCGGS